MTDSAAALVETLDYYPFGGIRIDVKPADSSFSEQRKYIGQEFDEATGLNYLNARYYNADIGRFTSQDPMFWNFDKEWLADPQNQNAYSYARNNPIVGSDPSGLLTLIIPGTWYNAKDPLGGFGSDFVNAVGKTFNDSANTQVISGESLWSGKDQDSARQAAAQAITDIINTHDFQEGEPLNLVGHSHGGNIANIVSQMTDRKIDSLVTLGTPVRSDYAPKYENIENHYNAYSSLDAIQRMGGGVSLTAVAGAVAGGALGSLAGPVGTFAGALAGGTVGAKLGWVEAGLAGRTYSGATNINVTWQSGINPFGSAHTSLPNTSVWSKIDKQINKK